MNIKYIAVDIDGTLLNREGKILPLTKDALIEVQKKGIEVILASGRPVKAMLGFAKELELEKYGGIIVSNNGAIGYDVKKHEIIFENPMDPKDVYDVLVHCEENNLVPMIEEGDYMLVRDVYEGVVDTGDFGRGRQNIIQSESRSGNYYLKEIPSLKDYVDFNVNKILTIVEPAILEKEREQLSAPFDDRLYVAQTSPFYLEFMKKGINKAFGLEKLGVDPDYLMSFGDSLNDKEMIIFSDYGIAMGNAQQEVKDAATYVTDDRDHEGIYKALIHFGLVD